MPTGTLAAAAATQSSRCRTSSMRSAKSQRRGKSAPERLCIRVTFYAIVVALVLSIIFIGYLYGSGAISYYAATADSTIALSLLFSFIVFAYMLAKGKRLSAIIEELGLSRKAMALRYVGFGIVLFLLFFAIESGMGWFSQVTGIEIVTNVAETLSNLPLYFYIFVFLVGPINEEILFRGFLAPRIGIIGSSVVFGIVHYISYFSVAELLAAFAFGLAAAYVFKRTGSLYPSIIGHALFDFVTVAFLFLL